MSNKDKKQYDKNEYDVFLDDNLNRELFSIDKDYDFVNDYCRRFNRIFAIITIIFYTIWISICFIVINKNYSQLNLLVVIMSFIGPYFIIKKISESYSKDKVYKYEWIYNKYKKIFIKAFKERKISKAKWTPSIITPFDPNFKSIAEIEEFFDYRKNENINKFTFI